MKIIYVVTLLFVFMSSVYAKMLNQENESGEEDKIISLVYFLENARNVDLEYIRNIVSKALNIKFDIDNPEATEFILDFPIPRDPGEPQINSYMIKLKEGIFIFNSSNSPYIENVHSFIKTLKDQRIGQALSKHNAWISVDLLSGVDENFGKKEIYKIIAKIIAELSDDDCLAIYAPEFELLNEYDSSIQENLRSENPLGIFDDPTFAPIINIESDNKDMQQAVKEAHDRWQEFVDAFNNKNNSESVYLVKTKFIDKEQIEFMWISVIDIEGTKISGILENMPLQLTNIKKGDKVTIDLADLNDWYYFDGENTVGGFTMKVLLLE